MKYIAIIFIHTFSTISYGQPSIPIALSRDSTVCRGGFGLFNVILQFGSVSDSATYSLYPSTGTVEMKDYDTSEWINIYENRNTLSDEPPTPFESGWERRQVVDFYQILFNKNNKFGGLIQNGGLVQLRFSIMMYSDSIAQDFKVFSNVIDCHLPPMPEDDLAAFNYILEHKTGFDGLEFLTDPYMGDIIIPRNEDFVKSIVILYPSSVLSLFARVQLAMNKCIVGHWDGNGQISTLLSNQLIQELDELSGSNVPNISIFLENLNDCIYKQY
ncbi:MAG: hypothetical protein IT260_12415 [Saprospiraceae bacterium]|nr:hypothetical protein [Saprospiraceae bacterium]